MQQKRKKNENVKGIKAQKIPISDFESNILSKFTEENKITSIFYGQHSLKVN